jgi:hypothetical protein
MDSYLFGVTLLRSVTSMHILHFPFFFLTCIVLANHLRYMTSRMTVASSNL